MTRTISLTISVFTLLCCSVLSGQSAYVNSLRTEVAQLDSSNPDSTHYKVHLELVKYFMNKNADSTIYYLKQCQEIARTLEYSSGFQDATYNLALQYKGIGDYSTATDLVNECLDSNPSKPMYAICIKLLGDIQRNQAQYKYALQNYQLADSLGQALKDTLFLGNLYNSMAIYYDLDHNYDYAITYHLKSAEISKAYRDTDGYATSMRNIAVIYNDIKEFGKAKEYIQEAKENLFEDNPKTAMHIMQTEAVALAGLNDINGAISAYQASNDIAQIYGAKQLASINMYNMASLYLSQNNFKSCESLIIEGLKRTELGEKKFRFLVLRATLRLAQNDCGRAQTTLDEAESYRHLVKDFYIKREFYKCLAELTACFGEHQKTGMYIDSSEIFFDSTYYNKKETEFRRLEAKYQNKVARDSINILKLKNSLQNNQINSQRYQKLGAFLLFLLGLALALLYRKYYNTQKSLYKALAEEKESLLFKNEELIAINKALEEEQVRKAVPVSSIPTTQLEVTVGEKTLGIAPKQLMYFQSEDNGTLLHLKTKSILTSMSLSAVHSQLDNDQFLQIYKSTVINTAYIKFLENTGVEMQDGTILKIGSKYRQEVIERFNQ